MIKSLENYSFDSHSVMLQKIHFGHGIVSSPKITYTQSKTEVALIGRSGLADAQFLLFYNISFEVLLPWAPISA
jgi:hypothetical protein